MKASFWWPLSFSSFSLNEVANRLADRWRLETPALFLPLVLVVFLVRHHLENENLLAGIKNSGRQAVLVSADIENDAVSNGTGTSKVSLYVTPRLPCHASMIDMGIPSPQWAFGILVFRDFPETF